MSIDLWWLGHATTNSAKVVVRADAAGVITISSDDDAFLPESTTADPAIDDGLVVFEVTHLEQDTRYAFTLSQGADSVSGKLRTMPETGPINVLWYSCSNRHQRWWALSVARKYDVRAIISVGDTPYTYPVNNWGEDTAFVEHAPLDMDTIYAHHRQEHRIPEFAKAIQEVPFYYMWNDHDGLSGDDWDHSLARANERIPNSFTTQEEVDAHFVAARHAYEAYSIGNPERAAEAPQKPPLSSRSDSDYPPQYFKFSIAHADFFVSDGVSHCGEMGTDTTIVGSNQRDWLVANLTASTNTFKVWVDGYKLWATSQSEAKNSWDSHPGERDHILNQVLGTTKGLIHLSGDRHHPTVQYATVNHYADYLVDVTACPFHNSYNQISPGYNSPSGYTDIIHYKAGGYSGGTEGLYRCVGILEISANAMTPRIVDIEENVRWQGTILAGSNQLEGV